MVSPEDPGTTPKLLKAATGCWWKLRGYIYIYIYIYIYMRHDAELCLRRVGLATVQGVAREGF
jgi:hypothetical protein